MSDETTTVIDRADERDTAEDVEVTVGDVLVEEVSIDGMCGVY